MLNRGHVLATAAWSRRIVVLKHLYTTALCCSCSTMTRPQRWVGTCSNAGYRRRLLHPTLLVLDQTPPRSWVCTMGFRLCRQADAQRTWNNLFHQQFIKPARFFSFFKWSARSYFGKRRRNFFGATKMQFMMTWYFIWITYAPRKCHILKFSFVRTHHARKNTKHCIFYWPEFKSPYRYWICFIHQTQGVS